MKIAHIIFCSLLFLFPIYSFDFGVTLDGNTSLPLSLGTDVDLASDLSYGGKASFWANGNVNSETSLEFQGSYTYSQTRPFFLELNTLQYGGQFFLSGKTPGILNIKAGRTSFSDFSGKVFSHSGDGISLGLDYPGINISLFGAYAGFLQQPSNSILMTQSDVADSAVDPVPLWGPLGVPRAIEGIALTIPAPIPDHTLLLSGIFQQDFRSDDRLASGGSRMNTYYAGLGMMGPIVPSLYYSFYGYGNTGSYGSETILAYLAGGGINYFIPTFHSSRLTLDALFSSGDGDHTSFYEGNQSGYSTAFVPITSAPAGTIFTAQQTNLFYISSSYSVKPFSGSPHKGLANFLALAKGTAFFRSTPGAISTGNTDSERDGLYLGTEADLNLVLRPTSDLGLSFGGGIYFPSLNMASQAIQVKASAAFSLSI
ncbi:MAG: hypothetical protein JXA95_16905 [Spirochaetales bacterium]|nr:hypothetical protein [Spirochaetales bacterium]